LPTTANSRAFLIFIQIAAKNRARSEANLLVLRLSKITPSCAIGAKKIPVPTRKIIALLFPACYSPAARLDRANLAACLPRIARNVEMATIDETKARLLRGVVQDNVDVLHNVRLPRKRPQKRSRFWLWGGLAATAIIALSMTLPAIPRGGAPALNAAPSQQNPVPNIEPLPSEPLPPPRPIDRSALPLSVQTIVIDAGHGGEPGATAETGVTEKEITLDIALRLRRLLKDAPFKVLLTRDADRRMSLDKRVAFANDNKADLFVSIHVNWMEPHTIRALETYYVGPTDDPEILKLTKRENKDSGYSLSDYKKILEKIYVDARRDDSRSLAVTIQNQLFRALSPDNPELENRGVKTAPFAVLIGTQMPAVLVEIACLSNDQEAELLTKENYRENIALALGRSIRSYANSVKAAGTKGS
jgi:N-acetylmuramoyl-L-alanine amidase